jgi:hypothetical protein
MDGHIHDSHECWGAVERRHDNGLRPQGPAGTRGQGTAFGPEEDQRTAPSVLPGGALSASPAINYRGNRIVVSVGRASLGKLLIGRLGM